MCGGVRRISSRNTSSPGKRSSERAAALRHLSLAFSGVWPMYCPNVGSNLDVASLNCRQIAPRRSR